MKSCLRSKKKLGTTYRKRVTIKECPGKRMPGRAKSQAAKSIAKVKVARGYPRAKKNRYTLDMWKCYLDSCASYHTFLVKEFLRNIGEENYNMNGN